MAIIVGIANIVNLSTLERISKYFLMQHLDGIFKIHLIYAHTQTLLGTGKYAF